MCFHCMSEFFFKFSYWLKENIIKRTNFFIQLKIKKMILIIFWITCFFISLGWNFQQNSGEIKFSGIIIDLIFGPFLTLMSIGAILRCIYERLNKNN